MTTFEEWWVLKGKVTAGIAPSKVVAHMAFADAVEYATAAEREQCAQEAYDAIVALSSKELADDVAAFIRKQETT